MSNPLVDSYLNESTKIDGKNYVNWKFKLIMVLEAYNLWTIVKEMSPNPQLLPQCQTRKNEK